ncbi:MAG TPA: hypothetical protein VER33_15635 [Polyangiaceae bacterium]|nr:hypothetical protein [Polyangiaceae bacterium]
METWQKGWVAALIHGDWGNRGSAWLAGRAAIVARSGSALRLSLAPGKTLTISVDDAESAAQLINAFVLRRSAVSESAAVSP